MPNTHEIRIAVAGVSGKMGREAVRAIQTDARFLLCAGLTRSAGQAAPDTTFPLYTDADHLLQEAHPDVWLDLTDAGSVISHIDVCLSYGVRPVIGATGYAPTDLERWNNICIDQQIGGIAVPNFAIGALLMMRFAADAAKFFPDAEIVELHHDRKKDAPSGTSKRTAEAIAEGRGTQASLVSSKNGQVSTRTGQDSRGLAYRGVPIHSVRLPGLVAHQQVMFGGTGEILTIRHDSLARSSFMPGVVLACSGVMQLTGMAYGLESLLW